MNLLQSWKILLSDRRKTFFLGLLIILGAFCTYTFSCFMVWIESRNGFTLQDPVLRHITPRDYSLITSLLTNIPIYLGLIWTMRRPQGMFYVFTAAIIICLFRIITIFFVPLEPPIGIIPLRDIVIETLFYQGNIIQKDLFFSGHTANIILVAMLVDTSWIKNTLVVCATIIGTLLMVQHVHYTIDILAAPFFAYLSFKISIYLVNKYLLNHSGLELRTGKILSEFGFKHEKQISEEYSG